MAEERTQKRAEERAQIDARKAARVPQKRCRDAQKSIQLAKQAKGKASYQSQSKVTKRRGGVAARRQRVVHARSPTPQPERARVDALSLLQENVGS